MRRVSLNARLAREAGSTAAIEAVLFEITQPGLEAPIRLSTDNTERLSDDPIMYGTRSAWRGADPLTEPYLWIVANVLLPSDQEDAPAATRIELENLDARMVGILTGFVTPPATVRMAVVLAETPDLVEAEWSGLQLLVSDIEAGTIALSLSREEIEAEYFPMGRMSRRRFMGLHL